MATIFEFARHPHPGLDAVEAIFDGVKDTRLASESLDPLLPHLLHLEDYWACSSEQAVVLAILLCFHLEEGTASIKQVIAHAGLKLGHANYLNALLKPLVAKKWLVPDKDPEKFPLTEYAVNAGVVRALLQGRKFVYREPKITSSLELITAFQHLMSDRKLRKFNYQDLVEKTSALTRKNQAVSLAAGILEKQLPPEDALHYYYFCLQYYLGIESIDLEMLQKDLLVPTADQYRIRHALRSGTHGLITAGIIREELVIGPFGGTNYSLTESGLKAFDPDARISSQIEEKLLRHIEPVTVAEKHLVFDPAGQEMIDRLYAMLHPDNFSRLSRRLESQGMKAGVSVLLYGDPGTGKTETVLQLGRASKRQIMTADASKLRSKWVGESSKNIRALFEEYRQSLKACAETPILLFNEADAILGKRHTVSDRGDQEMNAVQNILLEELEQFEGIFIATTNLVINLDQAFDRRFLYKVRFEKPGLETRKRIWQSKFPEADPAILEKVCSETELSGGQIENICKKVTVDTLLNESVSLTEAYLLELARAERQLETAGSRRNLIGFGRTG